MPACLSVCVYTSNRHLENKNEMNENKPSVVNIIPKAFGSDGRPSVWLCNIHTPARAAEPKGEDLQKQAVSQRHLTDAIERESWLVHLHLF